MSLCNHFSSCHILGHFVNFIILFLKILFEKVIQFDKILVDNFHHVINENFSSFVTLIKRRLESTENL